MPWRLEENQLLMCGHQDAVVYTEDSRGAAIALYLESGFEPMITNTTRGERERWQRALSRIDRPDLAVTVRDDYARVAGHTIVSS